MLWLSALVAIQLGRITRATQPSQLRRNPQAANNRGGLTGLPVQLTRRVSIRHEDHASLNRLSSAG